MAKISIIITGIALSYQKNNHWKVLFPFGNGHEVKFRYSTDNTTWSSPESLAKGNPSNRQIEIKIKNAAVSNHAEGNYYNDFIDFTGATAHRHGLKMVKNWEEKGILLTIPNASFRLFKFTNTKYVLNEITSSPNQTVFGPAIIGYSGVAHIETDSQGLDVVQIDNSADTKVIQSFNSDTSIWFDNDCLDLTASDTFMLYYLVEDANGDSKRFSSERDPMDVTAPHKVLAPISEEVIEAFEAPPLEPSVDLPNFATIFETPEPLVADPPEGVPCHKFRASKSDNLP